MPLACRRPAEAISSSLPMVVTRAMAVSGLGTKADVGVAGGDDVAVICVLLVGEGP